MCHEAVQVLFEHAVVVQTEVLEEITRLNVCVGQLARTTQVVYDRPYVLS